MPFSLYRDRHAKRRRRQIYLLLLLALISLGGLGLYRDPTILPTLADRLVAGSGPSATRPLATRSGPTSVRAGPTSVRTEASSVRKEASSTQAKPTSTPRRPRVASAASRTPASTAGANAGPTADGSRMPTDALPTGESPDLALDGLPGAALVDRPDAAPVGRPDSAPDATRNSPSSSGPDRLAMASGGPFEMPAPFLSFGRPFGSGLEQRGSAFYPYGSTGGGEYLLHHGIDIGNPMGSIVRAVGQGEVVFAGADTEGPAWGAEDERYPEGFYGRLIVIRHADKVDGLPLYSLYGHLSQLLVQRRQHVGAGQAIAAVGSAGIALGPHLHLEFRTKARDYMATRNPELFVQSPEGRGLIVGRLTDPAGKPLVGIDIGLYSLSEDGRETWIRQTNSYPAERINGTQELGENFVFADVEPGRYRVAAVPGGGRLTGDLTVVAGRPSAILLRR